MERGVNDTAAHKNYPVYACDVCGKPEDKPPCPVAFVKKN